MFATIRQRYEAWRKARTSATVRSPVSDADIERAAIEMARAGSRLGLTGAELVEMTRAVARSGLTGAALMERTKAFEAAQPPVRPRTPPRLRRSYRHMAS